MRARLEIALGAINVGSFLQRFQEHLTREAT